MRKLSRRQRISAMVLAAIAVCFITLDLGGGALRDAHTGVRGTLGSLYRGTDAVLGPARRWLQGVPSAGTHQATIDQLRSENARLRGRIADLEADRRTAARLAELQLASANSGHRLLPARVIAFGPGEGFDWTVTVDAGSRDGVRVGQTVTDGAGLVGRVLHADGASSVVLLAADPGSGVGVRDLRNGEIGLASGQGTGGFAFTPLDPAATVRVGDRLATGPNGASSYVAGILVGTVRSVRSSADGTLRAVVAPTASPTALDVVALVLSGSGAGLAQGTGR